MTINDAHILLSMLQCNMTVLISMCCLHLPNETTPAAKDVA